MDLDQVLKAGNALKAHPYTFMGLSDREKFHTGFLRFCLDRDNPGFFQALFDDQNCQRVCVDVEKETMDLVVMDASQRPLEKIKKKRKSHQQKYVGVAEVKLKTDLHDDQLEKKYSDAVRNGAKGLVIGLFPPTGNYTKTDFPFVGLTQEVLGLVKARENNFTDVEQSLVSLWIKYMENLGTLKSYVVEQNTCEIHADVVKILQDEEIKLKGIFQRYRYRLVASKLQELHFRKDLLEDGVGKGPLDLGNSHGNALLDLYTIPRRKKDKKEKEVDSVQMGLQWQSGVLKVFIDDGKNTKDKDELVKTIAEGIRKSMPDGEVQLRDEKLELNKPGSSPKFRSVNLMEKGWDVLRDDISNKHEILKHVYGVLDGFIDRAWKLDPRSHKR